MFSFLSLYRDQSRYAHSQWETLSHCNNVSHWLGAYLDLSLKRHCWFWYHWFSISKVDLPLVVDYNANFDTKPWFEPWWLIINKSLGSEILPKMFSFTKVFIQLSSASSPPSWCRAWCIQLISPWTKWPPLWQTTFSNRFSLMKMIEFLFKFLWNL